MTTDPAAAAPVPPTRQAASDRPPAPDRPATPLPSNRARPSEPPFPLPPLGEQADRLIGLGVATMAGIPAETLAAAASRPAPPDSLLVIHPGWAPASALAPLLRRSGRSGFVVSDMTDVDDFGPIEHARLPDGPVYLLHRPDRGDDMANWSPDEALPAMLQRGRTPLTIGEGIQWLLQRPEVLERNRCFMTIGSRLRKSHGAWDSRTPALWISNGTGRDGAGNRNAPKVGWCWAGNRHTWLGFASAAGRSGVTAPRPRRAPAASP